MTSKIPTFTGDETIADIVYENPAAMEFLFAHGIHCIGCPLAQQESLRDGLAKHGISDDAFETFLAELNDHCQTTC